MDEIFRFVALRPPAPPSDAITVDGESPLAVSLAKARGAPNGRDEMQKLAQSFVQSDDFVRDASSLNLPLEQLADALDEADASDGWSARDLVEGSLGSSAAAVVKSPKFSADLARLQDSVLAIKLAPPDDGDAAMVLRLLRAADVVQRIASGREDLGGSTGRLMLLPASIFPLPPGRVTDAVPPTKPFGPSPEQTQRDLVTRAEALGEALRALRVADQMTASSSAREMTDARVVDPRTRIEGMETRDLPSLLNLGAFPPTRIEEAETRVRASVPFSNQASALLLDTAAVSRLTPAVRQTLTTLGIDPTTTTLPSILHTLKTELGTTVSMMETGSPANLNLGGKRLWQA